MKGTTVGWRSTLITRAINSQGEPGEALSNQKIGGGQNTGTTDTRGVQRPSSAFIGHCVVTESDYPWLVREERGGGSSFSFLFRIGISDDTRTMMIAVGEITMDADGAAVILNTTLHFFNPFLI